MEPRPNELQDLEETIVRGGIELLDSFGAEGVFALERAVKRIQQACAAESLLLAPAWTQQKRPSKAS